MRIVENKGISKRDMVNIQAESLTFRDLAGLDSFVIKGVALCDNINNMTGEGNGTVVLNTSAGMASGVSTGIYSAAETILQLYTASEIVKGITARIFVEETSGRERFVMVIE